MLCFESVESYSSVDENKAYKMTISESCRPDREMGPEVPNALRIRSFFRGPTENFRSIVRVSLTVGEPIQLTSFGVSRQMDKIEY